MVRKAHLPALLDEPIKEHQKWRRHLLDLLLLAETLLNFAIRAFDPSGDTARLLLDAPSEVSGLLIGACDLDQVLSLAGSTRLVSLAHLTVRLEGIRGSQWSWSLNRWVQCLVASEGPLVERNTE